MGFLSPKAPDYQGAAQAQGEANAEVTRQQTYANRPEQYTPFGSVTYNPYQVTDPATGEPVTAWQQVTSLTPQLQEILDKQLAVQEGRSDVAGALTGRMLQEFTAPINYQGLTPAGEVPMEAFTLAENVNPSLSFEGLPTVNQYDPGTTINQISGRESIGTEPLQRSLDYSGVAEIGDPTQLRARAENALYGQMSGRINQQYDQQRQQMEIKLRNQGLAPGDELYQQQMQMLQQQQDDALLNAQNQAIQAGRAEQAQLFGQDVTRRQVGTSEQQSLGDFYNQAANQAFNQSLAAAGFGNEAAQQAFQQSLARGESLFGQQLGARELASREQQAMADYYNQAAQQRFNMAQTANQQNFQQQLQRSAYANQLRQQQLAELMQQRGFSLNEINALLSGQQVGLPQMPSFSQAQAAQPAPIYQAAADAGSMAAATNPFGAILGAGANLGAAAILAP